MDNKLSSIFALIFILFIALVSFWLNQEVKKELLEDFQPYDKETSAMLDSTKEIYKWGIYTRPPVKTMHSKNLTLMGDAAHPMVPFLGQGGCMAIEDAYTFGVLSGRLKGTFSEVQVAYEKLTSPKSFHLRKEQ